MGHHMKTISAALIASTLLCATAQAAETINYTYDPLGRVKTATHVGGDNDQMVITYTYDAAGNRIQYVVSGSKNKGRADGVVIVVPLNGFTIIPVGM
jgi:YD repeat-containing protein